MTAALEKVSAKPTWRYLDDAPPVSSPSRKRRLGAVLAYLAATAGVGAAIFWPHDNQALAFSEFKIPPSPFSASPAAAVASQSNPASIPKISQPAAANQPPRSLRTRSGQSPQPSSSITQPATSPARAQAWVPESRTAPPASITSPPTESQTAPQSPARHQAGARHRYWTRDTNPEGDFNHSSDSGPQSSDSPPSGIDNPWAG